MNVEIVEMTRTQVQAKHTEVGDLMVVTDLHNEFGEHVLLRIYEGLVDLNNPNLTWTVGPNSGPSFLVNVLPKGTKIMLTAE